jgi:hypothetical protein
VQGLIPAILLIASLNISVAKLKQYVGHFNLHPK